MQRPSLLNAIRLKKLRRLARQVEKLEPEMRALSDAQLKDYTRRFRLRLAHGDRLNNMLVEAYAVVR